MERRFRFRLEAALDRAARLEEVAALALGELGREQDRQREALYRAQEMMERAARALVAQQVGELHLPGVQVRRLHLEHAWERIEEQRLRLEEAEERVRDQQELVLRFRQEREKLERLRETQLAEYHRELLAEEGKVMEELSRLVFSRGGEG